MKTALLLLVTLLHAAQAEEILDNALDAWQQVTDTQMQERVEFGYEESFAQSAELFPETDRPTDESILEQRREERSKDYVTVQMGTALVTFRDVPVYEWFAPYVREIAERGIVSGYRDQQNVPTGLFGPADNVTVEQMAKVMVYTSGHTPQECGVGTGSILNASASGSWSKQFIACGERLGWALYQDGTVDVTRPATRTEVVQTMLQAFEVEVGGANGEIFTDVPATMQFAQHIEQAARDGIVSGYTDESGNLTGLFGPEDNVKRSEFAKIVTLGLQTYGN